MREREKWFRRCSSPLEEKASDSEFWSRMSPDERVALVEELRLDYLKITGGHYERLRRVAQVIQRPRR